MFKLVLFVAFLGLAAFGLSFLADQPGTIALDWLGYRIETTAFVAAIALLALVVLSIATWQVLRYLIHGPEALGMFVRTKRREKGLKAVGRGLVAVGAGDTQAAQRAAGEAERLLGNDPLTLLLKSQAAQLAGDRQGAVHSFEAMLANPETKALGLRGLYVEAQRAGDSAAARRHAEAAVVARPGIPWAANAVLAFQAGAKQWDAALATIRDNADSRLIDRAHAKRLRAVVLTAKAMQAEAADRARARQLALEAHGLAPELVPAAELAARLLSEANDVRKATRVIETTWKLAPHPDLADAYTHARMGDAARDRLKRARALADLAPRHREGLLAVAAAALEARAFDEARQALIPLIEHPTQRVCLMMAALAEAEGHVGEAREWLGRSVRAAPDPVWIADGYVSDRWLPVSPADAKLDAFVWKAPVETAPGAALPSITMPTIPDPVDVTPPELPAPVVASAPEPPPPPEVIAPPAPAPAPPPPAIEVITPAPEPPKPAPARPRLVAVPVLPDDPGPEPRETPASEKKRRFGIF
jgi:HemY protein